MDIEPLFQTTRQRGSASSPKTVFLLLRRGLEADALSAIRSGADISGGDERGNGCLHAATAFDNVQCMRALLGRGADPRSANGQRLTPAHMVCWMPDQAAADACLLLADSGLSPSEPLPGEGGCLMHSAAKAGPLAYAAAESRLAPGETGPFPTDANGMTALHAAAEWGRPRACVSLIALGEDPDAVDASGETALMKVARACSLRPGTESMLGTLRALLHAGCDASAVSTDGGDTALHMALGCEMATAELLRHAGEGIARARNRSGLTALDVAREAGRPSAGVLADYEGMLSERDALSAASRRQAGQARARRL